MNKDEQDKLKSKEYQEELKAKYNPDYVFKEYSIKRKISPIEQQIISEVTEQLFAVHYLDIGYNFIENDINIFYYFANKRKDENKNKLPMAKDLDHCFTIVQQITYIVRLLRYEQRLLGTYLLRCNVKLKDAYFNIKEMNKENNEELQEDLLQIIGLLADAEAMKQYLIMVFKILKIDKTKYKDVISKTPKKDYEIYLNYTLTEYLNDNAFLSDIFKKLEEVQDFLNKDNSKAYNEITNRLKKSNTDLTIKQAMQTIKNLNKETLKDASEMRQGLKAYNYNVEQFKTYLLNVCDADLLAISLRYLNVVSDYYREQLLLRGL